MSLIDDNGLDSIGHLTIYCMSLLLLKAMRGSDMIGQY